MNEATKTRVARGFAERLREAVNDGARATERRGRHKHRKATAPISSPLANPTRVRHSDELFVDRVRKALD